MDKVGSYIADAILGIDTLWGGDVMCPSGTGRFIADSWFSDEPLPPAYTVPSAARLRETGGVSGKTIDRKAVDEYLGAVDLPAAIAGVRKGAESQPALEKAYLVGLADSLDVMWDLAMEILGNGPAVPYERCVLASTARAPEPSAPEKKRERVAELLSARRLSLDFAGVAARQRRRVASRAHRSHGLGEGDGSSRDRAVRCAQRGESPTVLAR